MRRFRSSTISDYLKLGEKQIDSMLATLSQNLLITTTTVQDENQSATPVIVNKRELRPRTHQEWRIDYESIVKVVQYRHMQMLASLDTPANNIAEYKCVNSGCIRCNHVLTFTDVIHIAELTARAVANQARSGIIDASVLSAATDGDPTADAPDGTVTGPDGVTRTYVFSSYRCQTCKRALAEHSQWVLPLDQLKRELNLQLEPIEQLRSQVEQVLREKLELDALGTGDSADKAAGAGGSSADSGVGAKVGHSSTADLANVRAFCGSTPLCCALLAFMRSSHVNCDLLFLLHFAMFSLSYYFFFFVLVCYSRSGLLSSQLCDALSSLATANAVATVISIAARASLEGGPLVEPHDARRARRARACGDRARGRGAAERGSRGR